jgi:diacylglycerol O-acyltransferase
VAEEKPVVHPIDPTATGFLLAENRNMPMHVGGLQLFEKPEGAGRGYVREMYEQLRDVEQVAPLFLKHPHRSARTAGQLVWQPDEQFDIEHHVRHSALPKPGRAAMDTKTHHALVHGVSAMRLLASVLSTDPDERNMPAP